MTGKPAKRDPESMTEFESFFRPRDVFFWNSHHQHAAFQKEYPSPGFRLASGIIFTSAKLTERPDCFLCVVGDFRFAPRMVLG